MLFKDKVIVVTGAGSGMGRELTSQLVKKGARVAMVDLNMETMEETAQLAGEASVSKHAFSVTEKSKVDALPEEVIAKFGQVDGLINNAGIIQPFVPVKDLEYDTIERIMNVNLYGSLYMIKAFLPSFLNRPEAHIANVSRMGGFIPFPGQTLYSASKAAQKLLSEGLYDELRKTNVRVTIIHPGAIDTNIMTNSGVSLSGGLKAGDKGNQPKALSASKAAEIMIQGMEKNKFRILVGKDARMLDIFYRLNPRWAVDLINKQMEKLMS